MPGVPLPRPVHRRSLAQPRASMDDFDGVDADPSLPPIVQLDMEMGWRMVFGPDANPAIGKALDDCHTAHDSAMVACYQGRHLGDGRCGMSAIAKQRLRPTAPSAGRSLAASETAGRLTAHRTHAAAPHRGGLSGIALVGGGHCARHRRLPVPEPASRAAQRPPFPARPEAGRLVQLGGPQPGVCALCRQKAGYLADEKAHWQKVPIKVRIKVDAAERLPKQPQQQIQEHLAHA